MALGILMIMFVAMSVISVVGLSLLYLVKGFFMLWLCGG